MSTPVTGRLVECLADDESPELRKAAARAIGVSAGSRVRVQLGLFCDISVFQRPRALREGALPTRVSSSNVALRHSL